MSKFISIWKKNKSDLVSTELLYQICIQLEPDNIKANLPKIMVGPSWSFGIFNPMSSVKVSDSGLMLGMLFDDNPDWDKVGKEVPDGTFALVRNSDLEVEVCTDYSGSRSIWYYQSDNEFVVSTSQRAIVMYLGNLEWNEETVPWMLSTGTLGPYLSWDKRIKLVPRNSILRFDKKNWSSHIDQKVFEYLYKDTPDKDLKNNLIESVEHTFQKIDLSNSKWAVTLSGGKDSRAVFLLCKRFARFSFPIKTFTYGLRGHDKIRNTDGYIAGKLAEKYGVSHAYFSSFSISDQEEIETICNRLLKAGEGRVDHILGYLDGMLFWKHLFENQIEGIMRGDVVFGFPIDIDFKNYRESQYYGQSYLCEDWINFKSLPKELIDLQSWKPPFLKKENENFNDYHDRFYIEFRIPFILSALSDFKLSYVELCNPLLSRRIFENIKNLPTHLRKGSPIWKPYVQNLEPKIPFANNTTYDLGLNEMDKKEFKSYLLTKILNSPFLTEDLKTLAKQDEKVNEGLKRKIKKVFRKSNLKSILSFKQRFMLWRWSGGNKKQPKLEKEKLRNRIFIIAEMQRILLEDSRSIIAQKK